MIHQNNTLKTPFQKAKLRTNEDLDKLTYEMALLNCGDDDAAKASIKFHAKESTIHKTQHIELREMLKVVILNQQSLHTQLVYTNNNITVSPPWFHPKNHFNFLLFQIRRS